MDSDSSSVDEPLETGSANSPEICPVTPLQQGIMLEVSGDALAQHAAASRSCAPNVTYFAPKINGGYTSLTNLPFEDVQPLLVELGRIQQVSRTIANTVQTDLSTLCRHLPPAALSANAEYQEALARVRDTGTVEVQEFLSEDRMRAMWSNVTAEAGRRRRNAEAKRKRKHADDDDDEFTTDVAPNLPVGSAEQFWDDMDNFVQFPGMEDIDFIKENSGSEHLIAEALQIPELGDNFTEVWTRSEADSEIVKKKKKVYSSLLRQYRPRSDRLAITDKQIKKRVRELDEGLKVPRDFTQHSIAHRLVCGLIPVPKNHITATPRRLTVKSEESAAKKPRVGKGGTLTERIIDELSIVGIRISPDIDVSTPSDRRDDAICTALRLVQEKLLSRNVVHKDVLDSVVTKLDIYLAVKEDLEALQDAERAFEGLMSKRSRSSTQQLKQAMEVLEEARSKVDAHLTEHGNLLTGYVCSDGDFSGCPRS